MTGKHAAGQKTPASPVGHARAAALAVLTSVEKFGSYSNLKLNQVLKEAKLDTQERALATELTYGTLKRLNTIDWLLAPFIRSKGGLKALDTWVLCLLRLSVYQLKYLDRIPARAVVHQAVGLAKEWGHAGIAGFVNAVLRNYLRSPERPLPDDLSPHQRLALVHSHPAWLIRRWMAQYGMEMTEAICEKNNLPPVQAIRVNRLKETRESLRRRLAQALPGRFSDSPAALYGLRYEGPALLAQTSFFREGAFTIQDESAQLVSEILAPRPGMFLLDACAAPGGKSTHLAELMNDRGEVIAWDVHPHKVKLIQESAARLGLSSVKAQVQDARAPSMQEASFDAVLLDAPCSGFGVIRRKPDLKWRRQEQDIIALRDLQRELLKGVASLVRPGGVLIYSTCTIEREENEENITWFLQAFPTFRLDSHFPHPLLTQGQVQILPTAFNSDGFYIARLVRSH